MSEQKQYKWTKIGSMLKAKAPYDKNPDGSERMYLKIDKTVTLQEGQTLSLFPPKNENAPDFLVFDILRKNQNVE
jgi:hypothetical protein